MTAILNHQHLGVPAIDLSSVKRAFASLTTTFESWSAARERARRDAEYWALAQTDCRAMAKIWRAMCAESRQDMYERGAPKSHAARHDFS